MSVMAKRKLRTLEELYNATDNILEPKITPVLRGSWRMQGPVDETDHDAQMNTVSSLSDKGISRPSRSQKFHVREESGTCNVCSAPCSSCLHISRALMASKADESSDETSRDKTFSSSVNDAIPTVKNTSREIGNHSASETSNLMSVNSSHDSLSENAESKANLRTSEDIDTSPNLRISDKGNLMNKFVDPINQEGHDDNISCVSRANESNKLSTSDIGNKERINLPCSSASANSLVSEGYGKEVSYQTSPRFLNIKSEIEGIHEYIEKVHQPISLSIDKSALNNPSSKDTDNMQTREVGCVVKSEASIEICQKLEPQTDAADDLPADAMKSVELNQDLAKVKDESVVLSDAKETSLQSHPSDGSEEYDIVEHDVKVCDTCGDAGREDLLALCSRCSDGAEHTYCMGGMVEKVPEGDWICEECKSDEEIKNQKKDKFGSVDAANLLRIKSDVKGFDVEGNKPNKDHATVKASGKRHADDPEVSSVAKKQALEPGIVSPKISSPSKLGALSRDSSFKNLDRSKVKTAHQFPSDDIPEVASSPTTGSRLQNLRGALLKSNSFNFSNAKSKVKLVDDVPQKRKLTKESSFLDTKEGAARPINKSLSFKSLTSGRLNTGESKVKMLSPRHSFVQDLKGGLKHTKERSFFERKSSFKSDRPLVNSTITGSTVSTPKADQKLASRGETVSVSSPSNNRELKGQSDSKLVPLSKPTNHLVRKGSEPLPSGEVKRQLSRLPSVIGASSGNGISSSVEQKLLLKDDSSSNSDTAERFLCNVNESSTTNFVERIKESSTPRPRQSITTPGGRSVKETDHSSQFCTVDSARSLALDASATKYSKEEINKGNKLKAALEAALLKKPGIYRKNKVSDQPDELSMSSASSEIVSQDQMSSNFTRNPISSEDVNEGQEVPRNPNGDSCKQTDGKSLMTDLLSHASVTMSLFWKMSAIPEHEYIWQGSFGVHRNGKNTDLCDGFQAHLSTCASPKVLEAVNKFPRQVMLTEVPRLSTWPVQFEESGVKEDNIALYFFASDLESFDKSYKVLVENMLRNDLALIGSIDGVELLIFPSNQLPEKSQRWNMLYYLWGVFRGKRVNGSQQVPQSPKKLSTPRVIPTAIMSSPDNICSLRPMEKDLPRFDRACDLAANPPALVHLPRFSSTETINVYCDASASSLHRKANCLQINVEPQDCRPDSNSLSPIRKSNVQSCQEEGLVDTDCKPKAEIHACVSVPTGTDLNKCEKAPIDWDTPLDAHQASSQYINKVPAGMQHLPSAVTISEETVSEGNIPNRMNNSEDQLKYKRNSKSEGSSDADSAQMRERVLRIPNMDDLNSWHINHKKRPYEETVLKSTFAGTSLNSSLIDEGNTSKKPKSGFSGVFGFNDTSSSPEVFTSNSERYFFPVDPHPVDAFGSGDKSLPWMALSSANEDRLRDKAPNLELALGGAETKPVSKPGIPSFLVGKLDKRDNKADQTLNKAAIKEEDDDVAASLSLSLSFPFPGKDRAVQPVTKREQQIHVKPSLLLFGGLSDK